MTDKPNTWRQRWQDFTAQHPLLYFFFILGVAFLTGPLMLAAGRMTAVLYKDF